MSPKATRNADIEAEITSAEIGNPGPDEEIKRRAYEIYMERGEQPVPGIICMLAGATQRSDSDPYDTTSPPIPIGPHWMIMWPFDPKATGLPTTHRPNGAYIMWAGSPYAHLHVMGRP